jgi:hypothetical protein
MLAASPMLWNLHPVFFFVVTLWACIYFIPTIVAYGRKVANAGSVLVVNLFLGWTFIGWIVALAMAVRTNPTPMVVHVAAPGPASRGAVEDESGDPEAAAGAPAQFCPRCGQGLGADFRFCPFCGGAASSMQ